VWFWINYLNSLLESSNENWLCLTRTAQCPLGRYTTLIRKQKTPSAAHFFLLYSLKKLLICANLNIYFFKLASDKRLKARTHCLCEMKILRIYFLKFLFFFWILFIIYKLYRIRKVRRILWEKQDFFENIKTKKKL
jgi:hypothetical protein